MPKPKEANDRAVWWDIHLGAPAWYRTEAVTPADAAILLSGHNPNRETALDAAQTFTNASIGPEDYRRLLNVFEGADPARRRSLPDWIAYASARGLPMHPWVEEFHETFVSAYVISVGADKLVEIPTSQKKRRRWDHREYSDLLSLSIQPGMTQQKLADLYGVSRSFIGEQLKKARRMQVVPNFKFSNPFQKSSGQK
ncbi:hypothetical protein MCEGEM3_02721 [Oxalobacteraceae bacterium]